jgi:hypothetical protein
MPLWLLGIGRWLREAAQAVLGAFRRYPWQTVCLVLLGASLWLWTGKGKAEQRTAQVEAVRKADAITWAAADRINHGTINDLIDTLLNQSRMIRTWSATAQAKQDAAQAALKSANSRGERLEALARKIDVAPRGASWPICRSGEAVMAAKGGL